jgi:hypothetical protein
METRNGKIITSPSQVTFHDQDTVQKPVEQAPAEQPKAQAAEVAKEQAETLAAELSGAENPKSVLQQIFDRTQKH